MSNKILCKKSENRDASCDFNDIDEIEDGDFFAPVNQSTNKMDVESLLRKSKETREKIRNKINNNFSNDHKPTTIDSINLENKRKPNQSFTSSHKGDAESDTDVKREKHVIVEERKIDLTAHDFKDEKVEVLVQPKNSSQTYDGEDEAEDNLNRNSDPYLVYSNTTEMISKQPKTTK